jgi:ribose 5-phosphate isomerase B
MIYVGADKHGFAAIKFVEGYLKSRNIEFVNLGAQDEEQQVKLEDLLPKLTREILKDKQNKGIVACGTGVGVEVGMNKFSGVRACLADDERVAKYSRVYDDCNVLCLVGWNATQEKVEKIISAWIQAEYDGNADRLNMFDTFNSWGGNL